MPHALPVTPLTTPASPADITALASLLVDAVHGGAAVSFLQPLDLTTAANWWRTTIDSLHPRSSILVARDNGTIVGSVTISAAWAPNQPHRAEICKLLVHSSHHRRGIGESLMLAAEAAAKQASFTLLTLDAREGGPAERLYERLNWTRVGSIPNFAVNADHSGNHATVIFYKQLT
jgi:ribosomal protein S18 acetylase RimI-like enzyme